MSMRNKIERECAKNGIPCACKGCFDTKCKNENCGICCDCDEYWLHCENRRDVKLDLTDTKAVLAHLRKCFAGHLAVCKLGLERCETIVANGETLDDKDWETRKALQEGRIESYENCLSYICGLLDEIQEKENAREFLDFVLNRHGDKQDDRISEN